MTEPTLPPSASADYFDGIQARPRRVLVSVDGDKLTIRGEAVDRSVALASLRWSERQRHGAQIVTLADDTTLHGLADPAWARLQAALAPDSLVVRAQQSWRLSLVALVALVGVLIASWLWGMPLAARALVALVPHDVDQVVGEQAAVHIEEEWMEASRLPAERQEAIRTAFETAVARAWPDGGAPAWQLRFYNGKEVGANAFALPGGIIMVTDQLVARLEDGDADPARNRADADAMLVGVLAHELGHVDRRHGMRSVAQGLMLSLLSAAVFGDFSALLAGAPVVLIHNGYSRNFEREADQDSARVLKAAGYSPAVMATFFERLRDRNGSEGDGDGKGDPSTGLIGIGLSSHPADAERIDFFRRAAN